MYNAPVIQLVYIHITKTVYLDVFKTLYTWMVNTPTYIANLSVQVKMTNKISAILIERYNFDSFLILIFYLIIYISRYIFLNNHQISCKKMCCSHSQYLNWKILQPQHCKVHHIYRPMLPERNRIFTIIFIGTIFL